VSERPIPDSIKRRRDISVQVWNVPFSVSPESEFRKVKLIRDENIEMWSSLRFGIMATLCHQKQNMGEHRKLNTHLTITHVLPLLMALE
jgi:hypothetical protein